MLLDSSELYDRYLVAISFRGRLCGGVPRNKELIKSWVEATTGFKDEISERLTQADAELVVNEVAEKSWISFFEDKNGLFIQTRQVKACLKQSASILGITQKKRGSKQILAEGMEVKAIGGGDRLHLGRKAPDGTDESAIHVMTAQGPRTALRRMDYAEGVTLQFEIWILKTAAQENRHIGQKELENILRHAQENGLGASRSQGEGKFEVTRLEVL
jgi:CRISPR/Cas system CSM-associated protein Csm4 (group 5 of RAMP superfamily)